MKLLHTADVHIGAAFKGLGEKGREQRRQIRETFRKVIETALSEKVDLVLIAGDLFDGNVQGKDDIDFVVEQLRRLGDTPACLIGGTHDYIGANSALKKCGFDESARNVRLLDSDRPFVRFDDLDLTVYGFSLTSNKGRRNPVKDLSAEGRSRFNVGMVHGSFDTGQVDRDDWVFTAQDIEASGLNYLACGHWHSYFDIPTKRTRALYPGSPELIAIDQKDSGNIVIVNIDQAGAVRTDKRKVGRRRYEKLSLDAEMAFAGDNLKQELSKRADPDLIMDVEISGMVDLEGKRDLDNLVEDLEDRFFRLRIVDNSHIKLGAIDPSRYPENVTIGKFVRLMQERIASSEGPEKATAENALELGVALLSGKEVLK